MSTSFKSVTGSKVDPGIANNLGGARQNLQGPAYCVVNRGTVVRDVYGRPVSQNSLLLNDTACAYQDTKFTNNNKLYYECIERPYTGADQKVNCNVANVRPQPMKAAKPRSRRPQSLKQTL